MIIKLKCPNCNKVIKVKIINRKVISVETTPEKETSQEKMKELLEKLGIEFG